MTVVISFSIAAAITYLLRSSMMIIDERAASSPAAESAIGLVSPAVMAAIVASALLLDHGQNVRPDLADVLAIAVAILAVRRTGNVGVALVVGLPVSWFVSMVGHALGTA